jgi:4-amino-4-deoxy-L-arabinose transferase-like glycosyltransferase
MKKFLTEILHFENLNWRHWLFIFIVYFIVHIPVIEKNQYDSNLAIYQAEAFLNLKLEISKYFWDASVFEGKSYVSFPPFPAIVMIPFVALFGSHVNSLLVSILITCLSMFLFEQLLSKVMGNEPSKKWIFLGFFFGSGYWACLLTSHHINGFAHVVCTAMLFLLLYELNGKQRSWLVGLYFGLAFLTRQMTIFYSLIILYYLFSSKTDKRAGFINLIYVAFSFSSVCIPYLLFNYFRFHNFLDTGYQYLQYQSTTIHHRVEKFGLFSLNYFPSNFYHMFLKGHNLIFKGKDLLSVGGVDQFGTSLLTASPFVICSVKAIEQRSFRLHFWLTITLILIGVLLYHNNGWMQVNTQRFSLDFLPALIILVALGSKSIPYWLLRAFVIFSIGLNCFSFIIHAITS